MTQDELYLDKCKRTGQCLLEFSSWLKPALILVYGSMARGHLGMTSDIDILVVCDKTPEEMPPTRKTLMRELPVFVDGEFPYADVKIISKFSYENPKNDAYGVYIRNCQREGIVIWRQESVA